MKYLPLPLPPFETNRLMLLYKKRTGRRKMPDNLLPLKIGVENELRPHPASLLYAGAQVSFRSDRFAGGHRR